MAIEALLLAASRLRGELDRLTGELKRQQALAAAGGTGPAADQAAAAQWRALVALLHEQGWVNVSPQLVAGLVLPVTKGG